MLDEVTLKVAAHAAELSGPVLLFLYADKNGNGIREGEEPAQFRLTLGYTAVSNAFRSTP